MGSRIGIETLLCFRIHETNLNSFPFHSRPEIQLIWTQPPENRCLGVECGDRELDRNRLLLIESPVSRHGN